MAATPETIEFTRGDAGAVVAVMDRFAAAGNAPGWVNIGPALTDDEAARIPPRSGLAAWFSGRGPAVPMATWMPPVTTAKPRAAQIGVEHGTGPDALDRLDAAGKGLPPGWVKRQDHAKHGIVADLPAGIDHGVVVEWLVSAVTVLSDALPLGPRWMAVVHHSV